MPNGKNGPLKAIAPPGQGKVFKAIPPPGKIATIARRRAKAVGGNDEVVIYAVGAVALVGVGLGAFYLWNRSKQAQLAQIQQSQLVAARHRAALPAPMPVVQAAPQVPLISEIR